MADQAEPYAEYVAFLRRAVALLETVDDAHHPWTHNEYMDQVDRLLFELGPVLNDGCQHGSMACPDCDGATDD